MQKCRLIELSLNSSHISLYLLLRLVLFSTYLEGGNCEYSQNVEHLDLILYVLVDKSRLSAVFKNPNFAARGPRHFLPQLSSTHLEAPIKLRYNYTS